MQKKWFHLFMKCNCRGLVHCFLPLTINRSIMAIYSQQTSLLGVLTLADFPLLLGSDGL